jgi:hypothetical protein
MRRMISHTGCALVLTLLCHTVSAADSVSVTWQHRAIKFSYVGDTTAYVCDALESQVRRILVFFGARKDATVRASCPLGPEVPSHQSFVTADFYVPTPVDDPAANGIVQAHWTALLINAHHPDFIGKGDCELLQAMKDSVLQNFAARDLKYSTSCFPHALTDGDFLVTGTGLKVSGSP